MIDLVDHGHQLIGATARFGLPVVHIDTLFWEPGLVEPSAERFRERDHHAAALDARICEGSYAWRTFDLRLPPQTWSSGWMRHGGRVYCL